MTKRYYVHDPSAADSKFSGPYPEGSQVVIGGKLLVVVSTPPFYPVVEDSRPVGRVISTEAWDQGAQVVRRTYVSNPVTAREAYEQKEPRLTGYFKRIYNAGTLVNVNGATVVLPTDVGAQATYSTLVAGNGGLVTYVQLLPGGRWVKRTRRGTLATAVRIQVAVATHVQACLEAVTAHTVALDALLANDDVTGLQAYDVFVDAPGAPWPVVP